MKKSPSNLLIASMVVGTLSLSGCEKKEEVPLARYKYQESIENIISEGGVKDRKKINRAKDKCKEIYGDISCDYLIDNEKLYIPLGEIKSDTSLEAMLKLLRAKNNEINELKYKYDAFQYNVLILSLVIGIFSILLFLGLKKPRSKHDSEYHNAWLQAKAELEKINTSYKELSKANNASERQLKSFQKKIDELMEKNANLQEDINSKTAFIQELEQNILPGLKIGSVAGDIVDSFQMMTNIIEQLRQKLEQAGNEEDIGNFIAYNRASVDSLFTEIELSFARFASISENDAHLLTPVIALFQEAKIAYTKHMYKTAFEKAMQSVGILGYLENLQSQSNTAGTNNSSSESPQSIWSEYVVREGIPAEWLSSDGGLVDFFTILELDRQSDWSSEFQKQVKKHFRKMASRYHPDKNKDADAAENFRLAKLACNVLGDGQLFHTYTQALAFYINNI